MIDVSEVIADPELTRSFTVRRPTGAFAGEGEFQVTYADMALTGVVQPAGPRDVQMLPEGERLGNVISVWSTERLVCSDADKRLSDVLIVDGQFYRVVKADPWQDAGYMRVWAEGYVP